jgi:hypothetical protein
LDKAYSGRDLVDRRVVGRVESDKDAWIGASGM